MSRPTFVAKAMCLFFHEGKVLLYEAQSELGRKFLRPPGGHIEHGEYAADAVRREVREELSAEIHDIQQNALRENIFEYDGKPIHEYVFLFSAVFDDSSLYGLDRIPFIDSGKNGHLEWHDISSLKNSSVPVVPNGVLEECLKYMAR